jgi:hypothetical protein
MPRRTSIQLGSRFSRGEIEPSRPAKFMVKLGQQRIIKIAVLEG